MNVASRFSVLNAAQPSETGRHLASNTPFLLNAPDPIWQVKSGSLALFAIHVQQGIPKGRRRYLFSVKAGDTLFATAPPAASAAYQILAVALSPTELLPCSPAQFCEHLIGEPDRAVGQIEAWAHRLGGILANLMPSVAPTRIAACGLLDRGEVFQPPQGRISWVRALYGDVQFLGLPELTLRAPLPPLPLSTHTWLQAQQRVELDIQSRVEIADPQAFLTGLQTLQALVLSGIQHLEQDQLRQEISRVQQRERLNGLAVHNTLSDLANVFEVSQRAAQTDDLAIRPEDAAAAALLIAAGAVGRALGIAISPPVSDPDARRPPDPLEAIARASHMRIRRVTLRDRWWTQDGGPLLAYHPEDGRPIGLLPVNNNRYDLIDPLLQQRTRCTAALAASLAPTAYTFYRPLPALLLPINLVQFAVQGHHKELWMVLLAGIAATLVGMVTPQATAILIDDAIPNADRRLLVQLAMGLCCTALGATLFQLTQGFAIMRLETYADASTQAAVWDRLLNLPMSFFRQYAIGDLSARVSAISQIRQKLSSTLLKSLFSSLFSLLNLGLLFVYSAPLALIAVAVALINIGVTVTAGILTLRQVRPLLAEQGKLFGTLVQIINGVAKFRIAGAEPRAFAHWGKQYAHQLKLAMGTQGIDDNLTVIHKLLDVLTPAALFAFATMFLQDSQAHGGHFSTGNFLAFNAAFGTFISGATSLSSTAVEVLGALPIWERARPILQAIPEVDAAKVDPGGLSGQIAVEQAVFRYRPEGALILNHVTIKAEPGEFIALVGPSGSGKSTLLRLLLGFELAESGTVSYDGQDLAGLDVTAVRRQLGVVLQNSRLMSGSIFENISSSALISLDEAWEAARMAGFADDVTAMPMGMHTVVSEGGTNLSGGQRQRLLIARALALRPRILFFDEATSALDNRTQAIVSESLDRLKVTRVVVAHRLSTIRNADRIYVLQNGTLMQQGSFDALAQEAGLFQQLMQRQSL
jgi:NHLM bacteriocin system ABC transporter ATP-binding protein